MTTTKFFTYDQNNSGGSFIHDPHAGISHYVIIEADSADDADKRALDLGIYFDGCDMGWDCDCCGDRWGPTWSNGDDVPSVWGDEVKPGDSFKREGLFMKWIDGPEGYIHRLDGSVLPFWED